MVSKSHCTREMEGAGVDIIEGADHFLEAYRAAQFARTPPGPSENGTWSAPFSPKVNINFDVGFLESDHYQIAVVARNEEGQCLWSRTITKFPLYFPFRFLSKTFLVRLFAGRAIC